jgi:hypothetical protein
MPHRYNFARKRATRSRQYRASARSSSMSSPELTRRTPAVSAHGARGALDGGGWSRPWA